jgi:SulP family sulfate permease
VLLFSQAVELVAMPSMAALLIVAGYQTLNFEEIADVWDVSRASRLVMILTFAATLVLPIQYAVFLGVIVSVLHYVYSSAADIQVVEVVPGDAGSFIEHPAPKNLPSDRVTLLHVYGSLFYAGAYVLEEMLPSAKEARRAVVLLRLRGKARIGSTFIGVIERYAHKVQANGGKLLLVGLNAEIKAQLDRTETTETIAEEDIFLADDAWGEATRQALYAAHQWLRQQQVED